MFYKLLGVVVFFSTLKCNTFDHGIIVFVLHSNVSVHDHLYSDSVHIIDRVAFVHLLGTQLRYSATFHAYPTVLNFAGAIHVDLVAFRTGKGVSFLSHVSVKKSRALTIFVANMSRTTYFHSRTTMTEFIQANAFCKFIRDTQKDTVLIFNPYVQDLLELKVKVMQRMKGSGYNNIRIWKDSVTAEHFGNQFTMSFLPLNASETHPLLKRASAMGALCRLSYPDYEHVRKKMAVQENSHHIVCDISDVEDYYLFQHNQVIPKTRNYFEYLQKYEHVWITVENLDSEDSNYSAKGVGTMHDESTGINRKLTIYFLTSPEEGVSIFSVETKPQVTLTMLHDRKWRVGKFKVVEEHDIEKP